MKSLSIIYFVILATVLVNCSGPTKTDIRLVWTEIDTIKSGDQTICNRSDYYLINNHIYDPTAVHLAVDKYFKLHNTEYSIHYQNYRALFYRLTNDLNPKEIAAIHDNDKWQLFKHEEPFDEYYYSSGKQIH